MVLSDSASYEKGRRDVPNVQGVPGHNGAYSTGKCIQGNEIVCRGRNGKISNENVTELEK